MRFVLALACVACGSSDAPTPDYDFDPPDEEDLYGVWDENVSDDDVAEIELARSDDTRVELSGLENVYVKRTGHEMDEYELGQFEVLPDHEFTRGTYPGFRLVPVGSSSGGGGLQAITGYDGTLLYFDGSEDHTYSRR